MTNLKDKIELPVWMFGIIVTLVLALLGFTGSAPQVDVSYCSLAATDLDLLFGDLPVLTGKTIKITGNPGVAGCTQSIATLKGWAVTP